jgi:hypothetical protein
MCSKAHSFSNHKGLDLLVWRYWWTAAGPLGSVDGTIKLWPIVALWVDHLCLAPIRARA